MYQEQLPVTSGIFHLSCDVCGTADILIPSLDKGSMIQTHYLLRKDVPDVRSLRIDTTGMVDRGKTVFEEQRTQWAVAAGSFPYEMPEASWWQYCLAPHSYLDLGEGWCQVGLNFFNRFLHLSPESGCACFVDPGIGEDMLSTTNWYDRERRELWFASWPVEDTVRRLCNPEATARVKIWKSTLADGRISQVWQGDFGDALHQLAVSPDGRYLVLTELGLRAAASASPLHAEKASGNLLEKGRTGVIPSDVLVWDAMSGEEWRLSLRTAGHVAFDPDDPTIFYLSEHHIGLIGVKVGIFGPGSIQKYRMTGKGPVKLGEFTAPGFHRITTHTVFKHRDKALIAVTGYPGSVFLIDAAGMSLYRVIHWETEETAEDSLYPHLCHRDSYGIMPTPDGEALFVSGTGFIQFLDIEKGESLFSRNIDSYGANTCFTGHLGAVTMNGGSNIDG